MAPWQGWDRKRTKCGCGIFRVGRSCARVLAEYYHALKWAGAIYLFYLAVRVLVARDTSPTSPAAVTMTPWKVLGDGVMVAALNPKTAMFYAALLPQFIASPSFATEQALILSAIFVGIAAVSDTLYALIAGAYAGAALRRIARKPLSRYVAAAIYAVLGLVAISSHNRSQMGTHIP